ncbi:hypothetical protein PAXRUDRAFT_14508 [Paxillus rubicundulus Ve08.2h10]|uniref:Uncharacterized protein n=1 Tax=Paxillus rubicundulus Ve08.2h10 TaxID=930991 RepID=A0A0D0D989_9AGAM|nr:hypothetical protein PAXRUDRAFT_14508 [Paxillus rubicundulus Ve08.2h10]
MNFGISHEEAVQHLLKIWMVQNQLECQDWNIQQKWKLTKPDRNRNEEEAVHQEERKKNHNKFLPFNNVRVAPTIPIMPSPHALHKLQKGEYVELHYFTNKGLAEAQSISHSVDDNALTLLQDEQGLHSFVPIAVAKAKETVIPDHELMWPQIHR